MSDIFDKNVGGIGDQGREGDGANLPWLGATWRGRAATPAFGALSDHNPISAASRFPIGGRQNYRAPSRPGELHPEPLTDPDVTHPARATQ